MLQLNVVSIPLKIKMVKNPHKINNKIKLSQIMLIPGDFKVFMRLYVDLYASEFINMLLMLILYIKCI